MANFMIGGQIKEDPDEDDEVGTKVKFQFFINLSEFLIFQERRQSLRKKRHYKKDSRFLLDLYTLTFDEDEEVEEIPTCKTRIMNDLVISNSTPSSPNATRATSFIGLSVSKK